MKQALFFVKYAGVLAAFLGLFITAASCGGTVDSDTAGAAGAGGAGGCSGAPLSCESCGPSGLECHPDATCTAGCGGVVCSACPAEASDMHFGGCLCKCDASGQYTCSKADGCCLQDIDCGDEQYVPCVNGVCKQPVADGCWADAECKPGSKCEGEGVCECGSSCLVADVPGMCVPG